MAYVTVADAAREIRAEFKRQGWKARGISVRSSVYSLGSSISVEVRDPAIPLAAVREIAERAQDYRRDELCASSYEG